MATNAQATRMGRPRPTSTRRRRSDGIVLPEGRIRVVAEIAALLLIAVLLVALPILSRDARKTAISPSTTEVIVQTGDTLWSFARSNPLPGLTTAETADHIAALNGYDSSRIPVGSSIVVPVSSAGRDVACK